ncbi:sulfatase [Candidatus Latescibacterota bacterium]
MKRRDALKTIGTGTASAFIGGCASQQQKAAQRPNIIFIMSDDHASHAMSCYGSVINKTPNLDRLANEGMRFDNCFCTNSICAPSRAVILTGKYSHMNGVTDNIREFDSTQQTYTNLLRQGGYTTAMIGKWHLKSDPVGFDYWNILPGQGHYYNPDLIEMGEKKRYDGYVTDIITDLAIDWLGNRSDDKPFCLVYQHKAPHRNWMPGPDHLNMYEGEDIPEPATLLDDWKTKSDAAKNQEMTIMHHTYPAYDLKITPPDEGLDERMWDNSYNRMNPVQQKAWDDAYGPRNEAYHKAKLKGKDLAKYKYQRYIKDYLRSVASVDDNVGRLLDYLDDTGLAENTIVVYTSDQGFYLGDHGWFDKRFMYEESLRMPLIIRYPEKIQSGTVNDDIVVNIDFAPTFLDYAGVAVPSDIQGRTLRQVLEGATPPDWRTSMYYHYYEYPAWHMVKRHYGIRTEKYKLMHFYHDINAWELYDIEKDPEEMKNIYEDPSYSDIIEMLKVELTKLKEQYGETNEMIQRIRDEDLERRRSSTE